jgi:hypothetical protein
MSNSKMEEQVIVKNTGQSKRADVHITSMGYTDLLPAYESKSLRKPVEYSSKTVGVSYKLAHLNHCHNTTERSVA